MMKLPTHPARPMPTPEAIRSGEPIPVLDHGYLRYCAHLGDDLTPLEAARMSTGNPTGVDEAKDEATRDYLWRHSHATPFEMAVLQIEVQVPIFVAREWMRHRTQCLAGDTQLYFDLPGSQQRKKGNQLYKISIADFHRRWHEGTQHAIGKRKPDFAERIDTECWYSIPELSEVVERRKEDLRNLIRKGSLKATRRPAATKTEPQIWVKGQDWLEYAAHSFTAHVPMQDRLAKMQLRMCDEKTGEIRHTTVTDVWQSGVKPTFKITFENGYTITTSKDHRFFTESGWKTLEEATALKLGPTGSVTWRSEAPRFAVNGTPAYQDRTWLEAMRSQGMDVEAIAQAAGCSYHTIRKWLRVHGLQFTTTERSRLSGATQQGQKRSFARRTLSDESLARLEAARSGANSNFWKGGASSERALIGRWTSDQAKRLHQQNDYRCALCEVQGGRLHAHHADPVWHNPGAAREFGNLVTLCDRCHRAVHARNLELALLEAVKSNMPLVDFFATHGDPLPVPQGRRTATGPRTLVAHYVRIVSIEYAGEQMTYDLEVAGPYHNFVADGMVVHNSFNEFSGRYAQMPELFYEPTPERIQGQSATNKQGSSETLSDELKQHFLDSISEDQRLLRRRYVGYLEMGVARELARINLPLSQYTRFRAQANLRNWLHFLNLRMAENAQYEIRVYAHVLAHLIQLLWPRTWEVFAEHTLEGATLSRTEVRLVRELLAESLGVPSAELASVLETRLGTSLNISKKREFLAKLGL